MIIFRLPWKIQEFYHPQDKQQVIGEAKNFRWNDLACLGQCEDAAAGFQDKSRHTTRKMDGPSHHRCILLTHIAIPM